VPFEGAVEGKVELGQIKFSLEGQNYVLLTAMPTTRSEHVWVTHEPQYKLSQHMQGASDNRDMFMVRSLSRLLEEQSNPRPSPYQSSACAIPPAESSFTDQSKQTKTSKRFGDPQRERGGGWASWAIHGLFKKLTDCGDAS